MDKSDVEFETYPEEFSPKSFYEHYRDKLPQMVMVTQGYMGEVGFETFDKGQVFRIQTYSTQKRVVASISHVSGEKGLHGLQGRKISIPADYDAKFRVIKPWKPKGGRPYILREIIEQKDLPLDVHFAEDETHSVVNIGGAERTSSKFTLKLLDAYDDFYLLGNAICYGHLYGTVTAIPAYLPDLRFSIVKTIKGYTDEQYKEFLDVTDQFVKEHITFDSAFGNTDIALYSHEHVHVNENYSYISPTEYCDIDEILRNKTKKRSKQNKSDKGVVYEVYRVSTGSTGNSATNHSYDPLCPLNPPTSVLKNVEDGQSARNGEYDEIMIHNQGKTDEKSKSHRGKNFSNTARKPKPPVLTPKPEKSVLEKKKSELKNDPDAPPEIPMRVSVISQEQDLSSQNVSVIRKKYESANVGRALPQVQSVPDVTASTPQPVTPTRQSDYGVQYGLNVNVETLTMEDVSEWLHRLKLGKYADIFLENQVDGSLLKELDRHMLKEDFGMSDFEILKLSKFAKSGYVPKSRSDQS